MGGGAAEQWLKDHTKTTQFAEKLAAEIRTRNDELSAHPNGAAGQGKKAAQLRGQMAQFKQEVSQLEKSLMSLSMNPESHGLTRQELARRGDLMREISSRQEYLQEELKSGVRRPLDSALSRRAREAAREDLEGCSDEDVRLANQTRLMAQDEQLDCLEGSVYNLKSIGADIGQEVDLHCRLLGDLDEETDKARANIRAQKGSLAAIVEGTSVTCLWVCIVILILLILLVAILL